MMTALLRLLLILLLILFILSPGIVGVLAAQPSWRPVVLLVDGVAYLVLLLVAHSERK